MVKEVEELIRIVGKGNLLELAFIYLGVFQRASLDDSVGRVDDRHYNGLLPFIQKSNEPLDYYFNLQFSLQGLFLIYTKAYQILSKNNQLSTKEVIDKIYTIIEESELKQDISKIVNGRKLDLLNVLANPKREPIFKVEKDFEDKALIGIRKLLNKENTTATLNEHDKSFAINECVVECYYSIHKDIRVDKDIVLLLSMCNDYTKLSSPNESIEKKGISKIIENKLIYQYVQHLAQILQNIEIPSKNGLTKYTLNYEGISKLDETFNRLIAENKEYNQDFLCPDPNSVTKTLTELLRNQNSDEFEKRVTDPENTHYLAPQTENGYVPNFSRKKEKYTEYKNTACKLILGVFVLSTLLCAADCFLVEQKLLNPMRSILPQDNLANLVIAAVLTIIIVSAVFQLLKPQQELPLSMVNGIGDVANGSVASGYTR